MVMAIYDAINQLTKAYYDTYLATQWGNDVDAYSVKNLNYDLNGNIQTLDRRSPDGVTDNGYIDRLSYFFPATNSSGLSMALPRTTATILETTPTGFPATRPTNTPMI